MSAVFNFSDDQPPSKKQISKQVNDTFADPLNEHSIPYQLYLRPQKVEAKESEKSKPEKIWKVRPAAPLKEEKEEVEIPTMPERKMRDSSEDKISVSEMKGKRKSEGALPEAKRKRQNDHAPVEAYNFGKKNFKIFGQHKVVEKMKQGQKGKKGKKGERKSEPGEAGFFTEPNFGKMNQKSKAMKNAVKSFTVKK